MVIDILAVLALALGAYLGYKKGLVLTLFTALAWVLGLFAALKLTYVCTGLMRKWFHSESTLIPLITFMLLFIGVVFLVILFGKLVDKIISVAELGIVNKILGGIMKGALFLLLFSVMLWLFDEAGVVTKSVRADSKLYDYVSPIAPGFFHFVDHNLPALKGLLDDLKKYFNDFDMNGLLK